MDLLDRTKQAMGFKDIAGTCENCKHSYEEEDSYVDRMWYLICSFSNLCPFKTEKRSTCDKYEPK